MTEYGHYQDWETGELDLVAVAAHAAAELDALARGVETEPEALNILIGFLKNLSDPGCAHPTVSGLNPQLAMAINDAVRTSYSPPQSARSVADVIKEAARVASELASAAGRETSTEAQVRERVRRFCVELSRAAMTPISAGSDEEGGEIEFRATA
jgi:hypothetical protein